MNVGSCLSLNLNYSGCCVMSLSPPCNNNGCYCDQTCYVTNDCCSDIADIGCNPVSSSSHTHTSTNTLGKRKSYVHTIYQSRLFLNYHKSIKRLSNSSNNISLLTSFVVF